MVSYRLGDHPILCVSAWAVSYWCNSYIIPVLAMDPDFDDLPRDHTEGTSDDEITQEAVIRLARAAIEEMLVPTKAMLAVADAMGDYGREPWPAMIDAALGGAHD